MSRSLFEKRTKAKPYEYPELIEFVDAIRNSYWLHTEFNFTGDVQDFKTNITPFERNVITKAMLAISQIEVTVKRFWSDLYHYMPKPEVDMVGVSFGECHAEGTEVLTPKGWVDFKYLESNDEVLQYNADGSFSFVKCSNVIKEKYKGKMYNFTKRAWEAMVSPNHRIVYFNNKGELKEEYAESYNKDSSKYIPFAGYVNGTVIGLTPLDKLRIAIQADGSHRYWVNYRNGIRKHRGESKQCWTYEISVKKDRKKERLLSILNELDECLDYRFYNNDRDYLKVEIDLPQYMECKDFNWVDLKNKSYIWANEFIEELVEWDGYRLPYKVDCKRKYCTTNKSCADKVQAIGVLAGYYVTMNTYKDNRSENFSDVYTLSFNNNRYLLGNSTGQKLEVNYDGYIYCCTVPSGILLTRYNNCTFISGNSEARHFDAYSSLLERLGMNEIFDTIDQIPQLNARVDYLEAFMRDKNKSKEDFILTTVLFSLFIEHISLFSQFYVMMSFNKYKNMFKGLSNAIEATSKEEEIHGRFGIELFRILHVEHNELFTPLFYSELERLADKAFKAEMDIVDWIYESDEDTSENDLPFCRKEVVKNFIANRYNKSLQTLGVNKEYPVDKALLKETTWFDIEVLATKETDFFNKRSTDYSKRGKSITGDDLF